MASLFKRKGWYYGQFCDNSRKPRLKQVALQTRSGREAERRLRELEERFERRQFDPWSTTTEERPVDLTRLGSSIDAFLETRRNLSPHTYRRYQSVLSGLCVCLGAEADVTGVSHRDIQRFLAATKTRPVTKHSYVRAMRTYFRWLIGQGELHESPIDGLRLERAPQSFPRFLTPRDVDAICAAIKERSEASQVVEGTSLWLLPIVRTNVYLGLRAGELVNLRWEYVDLERRTLRVVNTDTFTTKAGKERTLPLCERVIEELRQIEKQSGWVFPNYSGEQLHRAYLSRRFKYFARAAGLPEHVNFHTTRHTCASWLAQQGCGVDAIRRYMGHGSISVTQKYMHLSPEGLAEQIERAFRRL
jgi:integrase/recombinase XerC